MSFYFCPKADFTGAENMALDEALLDLHLKGEIPPVLRLYTFAPPAVTIGYSQKMDEATAARIESRGYHVVRRPTGGRAVLHIDDITYCFVGSQTGTGKWGCLSSTVTGAYAEISTGLKLALEELGVEVELGKSQKAYRHLSDCFLATTQADLHFRGTKIAGSAQLRRNGAVLQHGSIPLKQDKTLMAELLDGDRSESSERHVNLFEILNTEVSQAKLNDAFESGFAKAFQTTFQRIDVSNLISNLNPNSTYSAS